jgi:superfamily II DNA or RNA helicase
MKRFGAPEANIVPEGESLNPSLKFTGNPYDYQTKIIDKFIGAGGNGLICVPCGKGKTFMALAIAAKLGRRFLIIVDKEFLLNQWRGEIEAFFPGLKIGILQGDSTQVGTETITAKDLTQAELKQKARDAKLPVGGNKEDLVKRLKDAGVDISPKKETVTYDCTICMLQTVVQRTLPDSTFKSYGFTIFDECHHLGAAHFSRVLTKVQTKWMLGLSATPKRDDGLTKVFEWFLGEAVYWEKVREPDATVSVLTLNCSYEDPDYEEVPVDWRGEAVLARLLGKVVDYRPRTEAIAEIIASWIKESAERRVLVLSERKSHLETFEGLLSPLGVEIGYYIGGMKEEDRDKSAASARVVLATYAMASEAMNIKTLNAVVLASPRKKVEQSTGRILRIRPEQRNLEHRILDVIDSHGIYKGQWQKRMSYYKQCQYKIYQLGQNGDRTEITYKHKAPVQLPEEQGCMISDD